MVTLGLSLMVSRGPILMKSLLARLGDLVVLGVKGALIQVEALQLQDPAPLGHSLQPWVVSGIMEGQAKGGPLQLGLPFCLYVTDPVLPGWG